MIDSPYPCKMRDGNEVRKVLLLVGITCILAALIYGFSGRVKAWGNVSYIVFFGVLFIGEYIRQTYYAKDDHE